MSIESWVLILVGFAVISSEKESMYDRRGFYKLSMGFGLISFFMMFTAVFLVWYRSF